MIQTTRKVETQSTSIRWWASGMVERRASPVRHGIGFEPWQQKERQGPDIVIRDGQVLRLPNNPLAQSNPDDASTGTPYKDIPPGWVFRSTRGFKGTKKANGQCVDHRNGGDVMLDADAECWRIVIGGWI